MTTVLGIGEALADRFVKEGSFVVAVGRRKEKLADLVHRHGHDNAQAVTLDITKMETIPNFVTNISNTHPDVDCIVIVPLESSPSFELADTHDIGVELGHATAMQFQ